MVNLMLIDSPVRSIGSVLIIENDDVLREVLVELMDFSNLACWDTPSGSEGIRLFERHQKNIDLVIMDMGLWDKNEAMVVQELEAVRPDVKVIIISGQEKKILDLQFKAHPNVAIIQKPFNTFGFLDKVGSYLGH